jgi:predicted outer membrane repeat protein
VICRGNAFDRLPNAATFLLLVSVLIAPLAHAATWTVNNTGDPASGTAANCTPGNSSTCTLRDAIAASAGGDTIAFSVGSNQTVTLTSNTALTVTPGITIDGSGSPGLAIDGNNATQVFHLNASASPPTATTTIQDLTITHGSGTTGGGIYTFQATLTLTRVVIIANSATKGGGLDEEYSSTITLDESVVQGNSATDATSGGGGIFLGQSTLTISRSLLSGNTTAGSGGAMWCEGDLSIVNSTIYGNSASGFEGGGGIHTYGVCTPFSLTNVTFLANSAAQGGPDLFERNPLTANNTIFGDGCLFYSSYAKITGANNLDAGASCGQPVGWSNVDLQLGPLQDNGGPTLTVKPGAAAIDAGSDTVCASAVIGGVDQRGFVRPQGVHCDVGAVEVQVCYVKFDATGANNGTSWVNAYTSLQSALADATCEAVEVARGVYKPTATTDRTISFIIRTGLAVYGGYAGTSSDRDAAVYRSVLSGDIDNNDTGTDGIDANAGQIVGNNSYRVVVMNGTGSGPVGPTTILDGFTITGGSATSGSEPTGGGLYCNGAASGATCSPRLNDLLFSGNQAGNGGALANDSTNGGVASPTVTNTTFSGNKATAYGGAIYNDGETFPGQIGTSSPTIANVTFVNNMAEAYGGAIYNHGYLSTSSPVITNATFFGNTAGLTTNGGAIENSAVSGYPGQASPVLTNVIFWGNTSPEVYNEDIPAAPILDHVVIQENACPTHSHSCTNLIGTDPKLGVLQDNGGPAATMMPGAGSSAIDAGLDTACAAAPVGGLDERRIPRPIGAHCDIGAVEATNLILTVDDGSLFALYGKSTQYTVTLHNLSATDTINGVHIYGLGSAALDDAGALWSCTTGTCTQTQTSGPFLDGATLAPNSQLTWHVNVPVLESASDATATFAVHSSGAAAVSDTDTLAIFRGTFDGP